MKTVVVTGATGFVGSHVLEALEKQADCKVVAACRDPARLVSTFAGEVRQGDLRDGHYRQQLLKGIDVVVHAAAWTSLWSNGASSNSLFFEPSISLLNDVVEAGVERFLFLSSTSNLVNVRDVPELKEGRQLKFWPHLSNVVKIENAMREKAGNTTMIALRCGLFAGARYNLGLLPILLPRLKTHLVPYITKGRTAMPIVDGEDIGQAFAKAALCADMQGYECFNIVGPEIPSVREVIDFLHEQFGYPKPHFSVPFPAGYVFAWLMEKLDILLPGDPLVVRSIIHLMEETHADNQRATERFDYQPIIHWQSAISKQIDEMQVRQLKPMPMAISLP